MKIKQKIFSLVVLAGITLAGTPLLAPQLAAADCGGAKTSIINCDQNSTQPKSAQDTGVWGLLLLIINIMTAGVGILAVGGIVWGAILYASSSVNAEQTKRAKLIIRDVAIGIVAYAAMYLALNFLIPGGIFS